MAFSGSGVPPSPPKPPLLPNSPAPDEEAAGVDDDPNAAVAEAELTAELCPPNTELGLAAA